jgi:uncharacterized protein YkwD
MALAVVGAVSLATASGGSPARVAERGTACANAGAPVAEATVKELRKSIRCLVNEERAVHGYGKLVRSAPLDKIAQRHTKVMIKTSCLSHRCPGEDDLETRVSDSGYPNGARLWRFAENTGCGTSALAMFDNWMDSVYHRVNILDEEFDDVGVGASPRRVSGRCKRKFGTFTVVFGTRTDS